MSIKTLQKGRMLGNIVLFGADFAPLGVDPRVFLVFHAFMNLLFNVIYVYP